MPAERLETFLNKEIEIEKFPLTSITGSGGKTSLMLVMAGLLRKKGRVVVTTTTKIGLSEGSALGNQFIGSAGDAIKKIAALPQRGALVAVRKKCGEKLCGFTPQEVDAISQSEIADWLLVEADGSRHLPLKAYEEWEPPIPALTSLQFVIIGADAFIKPFGEETAFRAELLEKRFGVERGIKLPLPTAARILSGRDEYLKNSPRRALRVLLLNKTDLLEKRELSEIVRGLSEVSGYHLLAAISLKTGMVYETRKFTGTRAEK